MAGSPLDRSNWTSPVPALVGVMITEVDMRDAGMSVIREEKLLPAELIKRLEALPKAARAIAVGKLSRTEQHRGLAGIITSGIKASVRRMCDENGIGDERILSVKRDAVYVIGNPPAKLNFGGVQFRLKSAYSAFARFGNVEIYASPRRSTYDIKGIAPERAEPHRGFIMLATLDILRMVERGDKKVAAATLEQLRVDYVARKLPLGFYREFNADSSYAIVIGTNRVAFNSHEDLDAGSINILFNLKNVINQLARAIV